MAEDRELAPAPLRLVQEFVNAVELEDGVDEIETRQGLASWLGERGFRGAVAATDPARARAAREGLRMLLEANAGAPVQAGAVDALDRALAPVTARIHIGAAGAGLSARRGGLDAALAAIAEAVMRATADGTWLRLKACRADSCRWAFYDRSKNRSGAWCSMAVCGSRMKVRAYRERHAGHT
jgi:predicted RNA-binding Zn ribbon-like protein